jgi:hypothetical protein
MAPDSSKLSHGADNRKRQMGVDEVRRSFFRRLRGFTLIQNRDGNFCSRGTQEKLCLGREFAKPIGGGHTAIHEKITAGDKRTIGTHEQGTDSSDFVGRASASSRA